MSYLFLWLAIMLNIAKWVYFFFVIKSHRSIREHEIEVELMSDDMNSKKVVSCTLENTETSSVDIELLTDNKDKDIGIKQQYLKELKTKTNILYTVVAILATALVSIVSYYTAKFAIDGVDLSFDEFSKDISKS